MGSISVVQAAGDCVASEARVAVLEAQANRCQVALDAITQGVAFFDQEQRLTLANRRYAAIYRLSPDQLRPGATLREIVELRAAAGTCPMAVDDYLAYVTTISAKREDHDWSATLRDGRTIRVHYHPMSDGGWVASHEDITESRERLLLIDERFSLQSLIDAVPDTLWVKDTQSRFVIANRATALRLCRATPRELIGKSDLEFLPRELAEKYRADERDIIETGDPMIDREEYVPTLDGGKAWAATTKVPLRDQHGEVVGVICVQRDITRRRLADAFRDGQAEILTMIAACAPAQGVLEELVHLLESQSSGSVASIMLLTDDARQALTESTIRRAIIGRRTDLLEGPLRKAICAGEVVIVPDIGADRSWVDRWAFFSACELRACWAIPISSRAGKPLGVLAIFASSAREPSDEEITLMQAGGQLAALAVEREDAKTAA
jgi:PAS domain S-box-containing protein